jgi:hypothetical protein
MEENSRTVIYACVRWTINVLFVLLGAGCYLLIVLYDIGSLSTEARLAAFLDPSICPRSKDLVWRAVRQCSGLFLASLPFAGVILWVRRQNWLAVSSALPLISLTVVTVASFDQTRLHMPTRHVVFFLLFVVEYLVTLPLVTGMLFWLTTSKRREG